MAEGPTLFVCHGDDGGTVITHSRAILAWIGRQDAHTDS